jgi:DNA-binding CsgD family transcriptional regulator
MAQPNRRGDVAAMVVRSALGACRRAGISLSPRTASQLESLSPVGRVSWNEFAGLTDEIDAQCAAHPALYERFGDGFNASAVELQGLAAIVPPASLYRLVIAMSAWAYPSLVYSVRHEKRRVHVTLALPPGHRDSEGFFRLSEYCLAHATGAIGLPRCATVARVGPRSGVYNLTLPPSRTLVARGRRAAHKLRLEGLDWLQAVQDEFRGLWQAGSAEPGPRGAPEEWQLTTREDAVLTHLAQGMSNKQIADVLGCAPRTVEIHVTRVLRKSGTSGRAELIARLWGGA